jgi:hypothetical protein
MMYPSTHSDVPQPPVLQSPRLIQFLQNHDVVEIVGILKSRNIWSFADVMAMDSSLKADVYLAAKGMYSPKILGKYAWSSRRKHNMGLICHSSGIDAGHQADDKPTQETLCQTLLTSPGLVDSASKYFGKDHIRTATDLLERSHNLAKHSVLLLGKAYEMVTLPKHKYPTGTDFTEVKNIRSVFRDALAWGIIGHIKGIDKIEPAHDMMKECLEHCQLEDTQSVSQTMKSFRMIRTCIVRHCMIQSDQLRKWEDKKQDDDDDQQLLDAEKEILEIEDKITSLEKENADLKETLKKYVQSSLLQ